jgi:hypothetical protein
LQRRYTFLTTMDSRRRGVLRYHDLQRERDEGTRRAESSYADMTFVNREAHIGDECVHTDTVQQTS